MKRIKKIIIVLFCTLASAFILLLLIGIYFPVQENIEDRVLENVKIDDIFSLTESLWWNHRIPIVLEIDGATDACLMKIPYSAQRTTVRELLDAVVPKDFFVWRTEGAVIHIIEKSLDTRSDYQLNAPIEKFSETGNYNDLILKALGKVRHGNFPEPVDFEPYAYKDWNIDKHLCPFKVKARNTTLRQLLDQIAVKGGILYSVRRLRSKDSAYHFLLPLKEEGMFGLSKIKDPAEPEPPCPKI
ncbi:MAG: hypothetical protein HY796_13005 [Elusimicrobia bacterium]|nr:hypothetical protein [Elusimicrobiota bacterium]